LDFEFFQKFLKIEQSNIFDHLNTDIVTDEGELQKSVLLEY